MAIRSIKLYSKTLKIKKKCLTLLITQDMFPVYLMDTKALSSLADGLITGQTGPFKTIHQA